MLALRGYGLLKKYSAADITMENENQAKPREEAVPQEEPVGGKAEKGAKGLPLRNVGRYINYVVFLVLIGLMYIWSSHVAEKQLRRESGLRKEVEAAKAEYKAMHARYSAGTQKSVVAVYADTLGLNVSLENVYRLERD